MAKKSTNRKPKTKRGNETMAKHGLSSKTTASSTSARKQATSMPVPMIVGIGASAGALKAIQELLRGLETQQVTELAFVLVQQLAPEGEDLRGELLKETASFSVIQFKKRSKLKPNTIYLAPPHSLVEIKEGTAFAKKVKGNSRPDAPIDYFLNSLAEDQQSNAIGIILSGSGTDGTIGLKAISDSGGLTFAQEPNSAQFDSMPMNAAATGVADHVLTPQEIADELASYAEHVAENSGPSRERKLQQDIEDAIPAIAELLLNVTNHNFQHYKTSTLCRRIQQRMQVLKIGDVDRYVRQLNDDSEETHALFKKLLIGVTQFFRDKDVFDEVAKSVIPKIFEKRRPEDPVRIWVAGCATGEEAYTIAILCRELMESIDRPPEVQIFASDIDDRALQIARSGAYPSGIKDDLTADRLKRFFVKKGKLYHVKKTIRELVLFSPHNLISDPPFSRLDFISCRNLLIYLGPHLQKKLIPLFHHALKPNSYLLLGPSEIVSTHKELFRSLDAKLRISQRKGAGVGSSDLGNTSGGNPARLLEAAGGSKIMGSKAYDIPDQSSDELIPVMQRIVLDEFAPKSVIVNEDGQVLCASADMQKYLTVAGGKFQNDIVKMARTGLKIGLRTAIAEANEHKRRVVHEDLSIRVDGELQRVMLTVQPMPKLGEDEELLLVVFHDVGTPLVRPGDNPEKSDDEVIKLGADGNASQFGATSNRADLIIEHLERELETTRDSLERSMQDMEAANEELKSSNEELLSMIEELHSANEELETSQEEVKAGLEVVSRSKSDLQNMLDGTRIGAIFLDSEGNINSFNAIVAEIYNIKPADIGRPLSDITHRAADMPQLPEAEFVANSTEPIEDDIKIDDLRWFRRRVLPYHHDERPLGFILAFVDITEHKRTESRLETTRDITRILARTQFPQQEMSDILERIRSHLNAEFCALWLLDNNEEKLLCVNVEYRRSNEGLSAFVQQTNNTTVGLNEGIPGCVFDSREPVWWRNISDDSRFVRRASAEQAALQDGVAAPVLTGNRCEGVIEVYTSTPIQGGQSLMTMLGEIGHEIGQANIRSRIEQRFRDEFSRKTAVLDAALDCIITMDIDGRIVDFNPAAQETFGYEQADVVGKLLAETIIPERFREQHQNGIQRFLDSGESNVIGERVELVGLRRDGTEFPVELAINVSRTQTGVPFFTGYIRDISERKLAEKMNAESEQRLKLALDAARMGNWEWDIVEDQIVWSDFLHEMFGYSKDEFKGTAEGFLEIVVPEDRAIVEAVIDSIHATNSDREEFECRTVRGTDGRIILAQCHGIVERDPEGRPLRIAGFAADVTTQRRIEQDAVDREAHLRRVIDNMIGFVGILDTEGTLVEINQTALLAGGIEREEVIGKKFWDCYWWSHDTEVSQRLQKAVALASSGEMVRYDAVVRMAGDSRMAVDFMMVPVTNKAGKVTHLIPSGVDISDRKRAELEQANREAHLRRVINHQLGLVGVIDRNGILLEVDDDSIRIAGLTREEVIGKHFAECAWWTYDPAIVRQMHKTMELAFAGEVVRYDVPLFAAGIDTPDQRLMIDFMMAPVLDAEGNVEFLIPSGVDISDRKRFEMQLQEAEKFNRTVLESSPDGVKVLDTDGRLEMMNAAGMRQMEVDDFDPLKGCEWWALWPDESQALVKQAVESAREQGEGRFKAFRPTAKGTPKWWDVIVTPVRDGESIQRFVAVSRDITRQKIEERNHTFRASLLDELNELDSTEPMVEIVTRRVAEHFDANRCYLVNIDSEAGVAEVFADYSGDLPSLVGNHRLADFHSCEVQQGIDTDEPLRIDDIRDSGRSREQVQQFEGFSFRSLAEGRYKKSKKTRHKLVVTKAEPFLWRDDQLDFLKDLAEMVNLSIERIRVREDIRAANAKLSAMFDQSVYQMGVINIEGVLTDINAATAIPIGFAEEDLLNTVFWETPLFEGQPEVQELMRVNFQRALEGESFQELVKFTFPDGTHGYSDFTFTPATDKDGKVMFVIFTGNMVTERVEAEKRIKQSEERLTMALKAAKMAAWEWREDESYWTPELYELMAISIDQTASPETFFQFVHQDDVDELVNHWEQTTKHGQPYNCEFRIVRPDGGVRWIVGAGQVEFDNVGNVKRVYGVNWDNTAEHHAAESLRKSEERAKAANESKTEFLANMSHEIRTPMSAIIGYADILARHLNDPDDLNCVSIIRSNGKFLLEIINDILDISKIEAGKIVLLKKVFRVDRLMADVRSLMQVRAAEKLIEFSIELNGEIPQKIKSDSKRLKQILVNLVGNAIKFTESGAVKLKLRMIAGDKPRLQFDIVDTGIGMSAEQQQKLFHPFTQADASVDRKFGGTGLGLAISQRLAKMLGGKIAVKSEPGKGSTFSLTIGIGTLKNTPMVDNDSWDRSSPEIQEPPAEKRRLDGRILVVDDRREIRFIAQHFIEDAGGTIETGENGQEAIDAIERAEANGNPFDLLVIDMQMPVLDGYEAVRRLRAAGFDKPIIALTAHAMEGDRENCLNAGCTDYIAKPLDGPQFTQLLQGYLAKKSATSTSSSSNLNGRKILIIDDARQAADAVSTLLTLNGHQVRTANTGESGIELAKSFNPEIVLLDLGLPDMTGFDVLEQLRNDPSLSSTKFIATTGRDNPGETSEAGFHHHIVKPVDIDALELWLQDSSSP